jgi:hypothetical protein
MAVDADGVRSAERSSDSLELIFTVALGPLHGKNAVHHVQLSM